MSAAHLFLTFAVLAHAVPLCAAEKKPPDERKFRLQWGDLAPLVAGNKISTVLTTGDRVEGKAVTVKPHALLLVITKSSDRSAYPKGEGMLPRTLLTELRVTKTTGYTWKIVGTVIGAGIGIAIGAPVLAIAGSEAAGIGAALLAGCPGLGFLAGWATDRKVTVITIVPDSPQADKPQRPRRASIAAVGS